MEWDAECWRKSAEGFRKFIEPLVGNIGRSERREGAALYVEGLLMPGERKSIEPMAARLRVDKQKLQQFITDSPWDPELLWTEIRKEVIPTLGVIDSWIIDETGWLKQGNKSVGVAHQYCGAVGKQANCQVSVHIAVSDGEIAAPAAARLYLPRSWTEDPERRRQAGIPEDVAFLTKPQIALELIKTLIADGTARAPVLGDSVYGNSPNLRHGLRQLGAEYFFHVDGSMLAWTEEVQRQKLRTKWSICDDQPKPSSLMEIAATIKKKQWKDCSWSAAGGKDRKTRLAWVRVYLQSDLNEDTGELPETWLVVDWPEDSKEPYHIYTACLHQHPHKLRCLRLSRSRWHIEQYFQRDKDELGLDHFEGRRWLGFHHHLVLAAIAYLFVLVIYLRSKKNFCPHVGSDIARDPAVALAVQRVLSALP